MIRMDVRAVLRAYDEQVRRHPELADPGMCAEQDDGVTLAVATSDGWNGVTWSNLDETTADEAIARAVERFAALDVPWEWKHYSYDRPADLPDRLRAAGLAPGEPETLLVAEITDLALDVPPPTGIELRPVVDAAGVDMLVRVHDQVFGGDHSALGRGLLAGLTRTPRSAAAVVAVADDTAVSAGRVEFHRGSGFAGLWGGGTLPAWRRRGVFRALVAHRAAVAAAEGFRYLQVDASADSRPILRRLGFVELATTTPFTRDRPGHDS